MRASAALVAIALGCGAPVWAQNPAAPVGRYDGSQPEMAVALELGKDGRFRYGLSYGALDERAEGVWAVENGTLYLTSQPKVTPPRFALVEDKPAPKGALSVRLSDPDALGGFPLTLIVTIAGEDRPRYIDADEEGRIPVEPGSIVTSIVPDLPVYDILYAPHALTPDTGHHLVFRFEPNDMGKADFAREALVIEDGALVFARHGRTIRLRREDQ
ncbi:MAG: hypothetical protein ACREB5_03410 [Sphingomonadaceae bacterium]